MSLSDQAQKFTQEFISSQSNDVQHDIMKSFEELLSSDITKASLKTGDLAIDFTLPNASGHLRDICKKVL